MNYLVEVKEICDLINQKQVDGVIDILKNSNGRVFVLGVGGSAANASHFVNDLRKLCNIEAYAPTDNVSELTARTNDDGWEHTFAPWLRVSKLNENDVVIILSVGGGNVEKNVSLNLIEAIDYATSVRAKIVGIVGRDGGYTKKKADACVVIPVVNPDHVTPHTEAFQMVLSHLIIWELKQNQSKW